MADPTRKQLRLHGRRKLLVLGPPALHERVAEAAPVDCDRVAVQDAHDAARALQADPELTLVLTAPGMELGALVALKAVRPRLQAILLTSDRALAREAAALELGDVAGLLAADASPAELREGIEEAFRRGGLRQVAYPEAPAGPPGDLHDAADRWIATSSGDRVQMQEDWLEVLAHDLRTPLGINNGYATVMLGQFGSMDHEARELLERMHSNGEWMLGLVDGMLDVARLKHGRAALQPQPVTLSELVTSVAERMRGMARPRGVSLEVERIRDKSAHAVDRLRVEQVLHNLIGNAIKFSHAGTTVRLGARADKNGLTFTVQDQGCGMEQAEAERVFAKYSSHAGGRGLGLAIAREIVELHGGRIWVESKPGHGTTFRFTIVPGTGREATAARPTRRRSGSPGVD